MAAEQDPVAQDVQNPAPASPADNDHKVFVGNLAFTTTEEGLTEFFTPSGKVLDARIITRGGKGGKPRSLGYGFVSFQSEEEVEKAEKDHDKKELDGRQINVEIARPKEVGTRAPRPRRRRARQGKNRKASKTDGQSEEDEATKEESTSATEGQEKSEGSRRKTRRSRKRQLTVPSKTMLFVANLPYSATDEMLNKLFTDRKYSVKSATIARMRNRRSKGYGFVEVETEEEQTRALEEIKNVEVEGRAIYLKVALSEGPHANGEEDQREEAEEGDKDVAEGKPATEKKSRRRPNKGKAEKSKKSDEEPLDEQKADADKEAKKETKDEKPKEEKAEAEKTEKPNGTAN